MSRYIPTYGQQLSADKPRYGITNPLPTGTRIRATNGDGVLTGSILAPLMGTSAVRMVYDGTGDSTLRWIAMWERAGWHWEVIE